MTRPFMHAAAAACLLAAGCSFQDPAVTLAQASLRERTDAASVLSLVLEAENPNEEAVPLREVSYTVSVDGREVFRATRSPEATLRRFGTQRVVVPAVIVGKTPDPSGATVEIRGTLLYTAPGQVAETLFDAGLRRPSVDFVATGRVGPATP